jgi:hypothetical protein
VGSGGSFGGNSLQQENGLGNAKAIAFIEIKWPASGTTQVFKNVAMDQILKIREFSPVPIPVKLKVLDLLSAARQNPSQAHHDHASTH